MKRLAVIDGKSVFYRGYYAMPSLSTADGVPTGGVYGFASLAIELIKKLEPDYVAVAWDKPKTNIRKRREIYPEYKAGRKPAPADFYEQIPILHELLDAFGWPLYELDDYEADDIMGAFAKEAEAKGIGVDLLTSDLDALQLISPNTKVYAMKNGLSNIEAFDVGYFEQKYGIRVDQFLDLKSLKGDSSDNLPGVPGIGEKTAVQLLQQYETLDGVYEHIDDIKPTIAAKLRAGKESAYMTREIGRIWVEAPVKLNWDIADVRDCDLERVAEILRRLEFSSLVRRLPKHMQLEHTGTALHFSQTSTIQEIPWPEVFQVDGPVYVTVEDGQLWVSTDGRTVMHTSVDEVDRGVWRAIGMSTCVAYDIKQLYHQLADLGVDVRFQEVHDIRQAAFLIDPLRRDRSLAALVGADLDSVPMYIGGLCDVYRWQKEAFSHTPKLADVALHFDFPVIYHLFKMERKGVKIDTKLLDDMSQEFGREHDRLEQQMYTLAGREFNIASPSQLSEVLFVDLNLPTTGIKKGKTGYSTDQKTLDKLRQLHPIIDLIEQTRELAKLKSTYVDALPKLVDSHGRVHTTLNQDVAATGRLSSTNPNLQNIPVRTELGKRIRQAFIPDGGNVLISADYSQFELRLAAVLAGDTELINDFNGDIDVHTKTAAEVYGIPMDSVTKDQRRAAKVINFGVLYGMSPHGLSAATGMSFSDAKAFITHYFEIRSPIREYIELTLKKAETDGYVETYYGRRRPTPDVHSSNFIVREAAKRAAANMPLQGTEADLMKRAMIMVGDKLDGRGDQILQIHDSILVECAPEFAEEIATMMKTVMEGVAPELPIHLKVDVSMGVHWGDL